MEQTKATTLHLLTRDGVVTCRFESGLTHEQYDSLFKFVQRAETREELESYLVRFATKWKTEIVFGD